MKNNESGKLEIPNVMVSFGLISSLDLLSIFFNI